MYISINVSSTYQEKEFASPSLALSLLQELEVIVFFLLIEVSLWEEKTARQMDYKRQKKKDKCMPEEQFFLSSLL